jgi:hypothetical protein
MMILFLNPVISRKITEEPSYLLIPTEFCFVCSVLFCVDVVLESTSVAVATVFVVVVVLVGPVLDENWVC